MTSCRTFVSIVVASFAITLQITQSTAAITSSAWTGRLQIGDRMFVDGTGQPVLPLCAHFIEAFSAWVRRPAEVEDQLHAIKNAGYDCIRFFDNLGEYSQAWRGKEITPFSWTNGDGIRIEATPDYYEKLRQFLELLDDIGLSAHHTRGDLGRYKPAVPLDSVVEHSNRITALYDEVGWSVLALYEGNNEDFQNGSFGPAGLLRIVEPLKAGGAIVASSCAPFCSEEKQDVLTYSRGFSVRYYHAERGGDATHRLARKFSSGYEPPEGTPYLGWDGEPIGPNNDRGPGVSINHTEDVEELALIHAMTFVGGRSATTYMSQHGVFWNGPIHRQSGFYVTPRMRAAIYAFAPNVMQWSLYDGGRPEAVLRSPDGYFSDGGATHGPARLDQAVSPDRKKVVALIYGGRAPRRFRNDLKCTASVTVVWPRDDEQVQADKFRLAAGQVREIDYRVGRVLFAECVK